MPKLNSLALPRGQHNSILETRSPVLSDGITPMRALSEIPSVQRIDAHSEALVNAIERCYTNQSLLQDKAAAENGRDDLCRYLMGSLVLSDHLCSLNVEVFADMDKVKPLTSALKRSSFNRNMRLTLNLNFSQRRLLDQDEMLEIGESIGAMACDNNTIKHIKLFAHSPRDELPLPGPLAPIPPAMLGAILKKVAMSEIVSFHAPLMFPLEWGDSDIEETSQLLDKNCWCLEDFVVNNAQLCPALELFHFYSKLNKAGRRRIENDSATPEQWIQTLTNVGSDTASVYQLLTKNPNLIIDAAKVSSRRGGSNPSCARKRNARGSEDDNERSKKRRTSFWSTWLGKHGYV